MDAAARGVYRGQVTKLAKAARDYLSSADSKVGEENVSKFEEIEEELAAYIERLTVASEGLSRLNTELKPLQKPEDAQKEWETILDYDDKAAGMLARLKQRLSNLREFQDRRNNSGTVNRVSTDNPRMSSAKLPKLTLRTFSGDFKDWIPFWERFRTAIHERRDINGADKFNYLQNHLMGKAAESIAGFTPTDANYDAAISMLLEEYGDNEKLIDYTIQQLMSLPQVSNRSDIINLRKLYNSVTTHTRSLTVLGVSATQYSIMLRAIILKCLPRDLVVEFYRSHPEGEQKVKEASSADVGDDLNSLANSEDSKVSAGGEKLRRILDFLKKEVASLERSAQNPVKKSNLQVHPKHSNTAASLLTPLSGSQNCYFCKAVTHSTAECNASHSMSERKSMLKGDGRCFRCTKRGHNSKTCKNKYIKCKCCSGNHATSVCDPNYRSIKLTQQSKVADANAVSDIKSNSDGQKINQQKVSTATTLCSPATSCSSQVFLQTARMIASSPFNCGSETILVRAILDGGSQRSYVRQCIAEGLKLKIVDTVSIRIMPFGCSTKVLVKRLNRVKIKLQSVHDGQCIIVLAVVVPDICPDVLIDPNSSSELFTDLPMADDHSFGTPLGGIGLLLGADVYWSIVQDGFKRVSKGLVAVETIFGWTVHGPTVNSCDSCEVLSIACLTTVDAEEHFFEDREKIESFWNLEGIGITPPNVAKNSITDIDCYINKNKERYEASLIWKDPKCAIDSNYKGAHFRYNKLIDRLSKSQEKLKEYDNLMWDLILSGVAERCNEKIEDNQRVYYMPHRPVYRDDKITTKTRIVFDASSKTGANFSLNDLLSPGPNLLPDVLEVLLNFRLGTVGLVGDIEKAFLQISLSPKDYDVHRFIWFSNKINSEKLPTRAIYRLKRVTFGVSCSPSLLCATLQKHFRTEMRNYTETCQLLKNSFYMDDLVVSMDDTSEAFKFFKETGEIMQNAAMNIYKWNSNDQYLRQEFSKSRNLSETQKVLGLIWYCQTDELAVDINKVCNEIPINITKRTLLQLVARIYDPIGVLGPFTVKLKLLFQESWRRKLDWDEPLPVQMVTDWNKCIKNLPLLQNIKFPRCVFGSGKRINQQLHIFSDASPHAFGAVAYVRSEDQNGSITVSFLCSRNRVAPIRTDDSKQLTLPKMELTAALIAARLFKYLREHLRIKFDSEHLWTDSQICLYWINGNKSKRETYIDQRIQEIRKLTAINSWRHCPGDQNPADLLTRGVLVKTLCNSSNWMCEPSWLARKITDWPLQQTQVNVLSYSPCFLTPSNDEPQCKVHEPIFKMDKFSRYRKLIRVTAYVQRFIKCLRSEVPEGKYLSAIELREAELYWIRLVQSERYWEEIIALRSMKPIRKESDIFSLSPIIDENGTLRVGSRLSESTFSYDEKFPIILPNDSYLTTLLILNCHETTLHGGVNQVLVRLRETFWIIKGRQTIKKLLRRCGICKRLKGKAAVQPFAPLPKERLIASRPFETTGVDFAGPLYVWRSKGDNCTKKVYILLLTCAVVRAVHLELVEDMTTESCILAFKRFFARRGIPKLVLSDNARTFKRAAFEFRELNTIIHSENLQNYASNVGISWGFIVERAAWWGGFWERLVRNVKDILKSSIGRLTLTSDQLQTYLIEAEFIINSRPLTYISEDSADLSPLTPNHFLLGTFPALLALNDVAPTGRDLRQKWQARFRLVNKFFKRFRVEYVQQLRSAHHNHPSFSQGLQPGNVVIVHDSSVPRLFWKLARVQQVFPGRDGKVRACEVKFHNGVTTRRSVQHLFPLEVQAETAAGGC